MIIVLFSLRAAGVAIAKHCDSVVAILQRQLSLQILDVSFSEMDRVMQRQRAFSAGTATGCSCERFCLQVIRVSLHRSGCARWH